MPGFKHGCLQELQQCHEHLDSLLSSASFMMGSLLRTYIPSASDPVREDTCLGTQCINPSVTGAKGMRASDCPDWVSCSSLCYGWDSTQIAPTERGKISGSNGKIRSFFWKEWSPYWGGEEHLPGRQSWTDPQEIALTSVHWPHSKAGKRSSLVRRESSSFS